MINDIINLGMNFEESCLKMIFTRILRVMGIRDLELVIIKAK